MRAAAAGNRDAYTWLKRLPRRSDSQTGPSVEGPKSGAAPSPASGASHACCKASRAALIFDTCRSMQQHERGGKVTIIDIAREAGVSIKTVSRVINREEGVSEETRARVQALVNLLGYRPNVSARSLSSRRSYLIGAIFMRVGAYHYVGE